MQSKKRSGPITEPCGTPDLTGTFGEHSPSSTTAWVRIVGYLMIVSISSLLQVGYRVFTNMYEFLDICRYKSHVMRKPVLAICEQLRRR